MFVTSYRKNKANRPTMSPQRFALCDDGVGGGDVGGGGGGGSGVGSDGGRGSGILSPRMILSS